jgi:hypothetical protein
MLRDSVTAACPQVQVAIGQLLQEETTYHQVVHRTIHRDHLARPVTVHFNGGEVELAGFCRSVSVAGMTILTKTPCEVQSVAKLEVHRTEAEPVWFLAECRMVSPFGEGWYLSSWQLIAVQARPV